MTKLLPYSSLSQSLFLLLICRICGFQGCTTKYRNSNQRSVTKLRKQLDSAEGVKPYWKPGAKCCCSAHLAALRALVAIKPVLYVLSECKLTECFDWWDCLISAANVSDVISWILMPPSWPSLMPFTKFVCHRFEQRKPSRKKSGIGRLHKGSVRVKQGNLFCFLHCYMLPTHL